ncbi:MAG: hypothetical protein SOW25_05445, partial [Helicobacter sp.]|nr:hypothetical protein [Helicobacter sp.]
GDVKIKLDLKVKNPTFSNNTRIEINNYLQALEAEMENIKIRLEKEAQEAEAKRQDEIKRTQELKAKRDAIIKEKEALSGKNALETNLKEKDEIPLKRLDNFKSSISLSENEIIPLEYAIIKKEYLKPNFENSGTQGRLRKQDNIIESIANDFNPSQIFNRGEFKELPIIDNKGNIISGNHRIQGFLNFTQESSDKYKQAAKDNFNIDLADDELLIRIPKDDLSQSQIVALGFASNKDALNTIGEKALQSLGQYNTKIKQLPPLIHATSADEMAMAIGRALSDTQYPDIESTNLALLSYLAKNNDSQNIGEVLDSINFLDLEKKTKLKDLFVKNAGAFYNLVNAVGDNLQGLNKLEIRPYLIDIIRHTAQGLQNTRAENYERLIRQIQDLLKTTDSDGKSPFILETPTIYGEIISEAIGYSLSRFVELENPANQLFQEINLPILREQLSDLIGPNLFDTKGRPLSEADIYDLATLLISKGRESSQQGDLIALLPQLKEKDEAFKKYLQKDKPTDIKQEAKVDIFTLRSETKNNLEKLLNKDIINAHDGRVAQVTRKNIAKMTSDKAIEKSVKNGFTQEEHFKAVNNIEALFQNATFKETSKDLKSDNPNILIHRYLSKDGDNNVLLTIKETLKNDSGNRIYSLELEALELKASAPDPQGNSLASRNTGRAEPVTPAKESSEIIPQNAEKNAKQQEEPRVVYIDNGENMVTYTNKGLSEQEKLLKDINKAYMYIMQKDLGLSGLFIEDVEKNLKEIESALSKDYIDLYKEALEKLKALRVAKIYDKKRALSNKLGKELDNLSQIIYKKIQEDKAESTQAIYKDSSGNIKTEADIEKEILEKNPSINNYKDENKKEELRIAKRSVIKQQGLKLIEYKPQARLNPTDPQDVILSASEKSKKKMRYFALLSMTKRMRYFAQLSMTK